MYRMYDQWTKLKVIPGLYSDLSVNQTRGHGNELQGAKVESTHFIVV